MAGISPTPDIVPLAQRRGLRVLSDGQLATLHEATLTILEEIGVHVPSARARDLLGDNGAAVADDGVVRIPADLVRRALATAPRSLLLAGREERLDLVLDGERSYVATEGVGVHVVDLETRQLRPSRKADVAQMARVCDALPLLAFFWPPVSAQDHGITAPLHECHAGLTNTLKHVRGATTVRPSLARYIVDMATVVAGDAARRRRRPPICGNICTISPLAHDEHGLECAITYAEAGIPFSFMAMTTMGTVAPATALGALAQGDAEVISGVVIAQLAAPGAPVFHSVLISMVDPYSGGYISEVPLPIGWMAVELAHSWGLPALAGGGLDTDDAAVGWLAGRSAGIGAALSVLCGGEIAGYLGLTGGSTVLFPEQLILQHETLLDAAAELGAVGMPGAFEFNAVDIAFDVIRDVGPRGHFLKHRHTRERLRQLRFPPWVRPVGRRGAAGAGTVGDAAGAGRSGDATGAQSTGAETAGSRVPGSADLDVQATRASGGIDPAAPAAAALEEYRRLAAEHVPAPLPDDVLAELDSILAAADRETEGLA